MKNLLYRTLGYEKANVTEIKWQILPSLFKWALGFGELHLESTCMCHLVATLWNYYLFGREKQEAKWAQMFLKNPCFKKKIKTEKINFIANFRLVQTGKIISSKVVVSCQTRKATENIWNILLCLQR